ncbi:MAG: hypothetical protein ACU833_12510, partial [Gammaproteobacteria bacterium]
KPSLESRLISCQKYSGIGKGFAEEVFNRLNLSIQTRHFEGLIPVYRAEHRRFAAEQPEGDAQGGASLPEGQEAPSGKPGANREAQGTRRAR